MSLPAFVTELSARKAADPIHHVCQLYVQGLQVAGARMLKTKVTDGSGVLKMQIALHGMISLSACLRYSVLDWSHLCGLALRSRDAMIDGKGRSLPGSRLQLFSDRRRQWL